MAKTGSKAPAEPPTAEELKLAGQMVPYLRESGWLESRRSRRPVDRDGQPLPWITYPAIDFLAPRVRPDMRVFEFGSGNSTLWWAARVARVTVVEHDAKWAREVAASIPPSVDFHHVELERGGDYCRSAQRMPGPYDIVVVDGRDRVNCALQSVDSLAPDGVLVWDNTERGRYRPGFRTLEERGFRRLEFRGPSPINTWTSETSVFYRPSNCLGI